MKAYPQVGIDMDNEYSVYSKQEKYVVDKYLKNSKN